MKKILLTTVALLSMASASVFGMYGVDSDWIDFLTHGNQFRARLEQLGFTLGNDTIKGTFGFDSPSSTLGQIFSTGNDGTASWYPNISAGIGYTSSAISVGVGYNATIGNKWRGVDGKQHRQAAHTPVLVLNAMDNAFRMAIPIQVFATKDIASFNQNEFTGGATSTNSITAVSLDPQFRYYTGLDFLPQIRLLIYYGHQESEAKSTSADTKTKLDSFGFQFRIYFGSMVEDVALNPILRITYKTALGRHGNTDIKAVNVARNGLYSGYTYTNPTENNNGTTYYYDTAAYEVLIRPSLGLTANSDIVSLYLEPYLGYVITEYGINNTKLKHDLNYGVYGEIYIRPLQNLEWYFEAELGNYLDGTTVSGENIGVVNKRGLGFNAGTGITWYLPAL